MNDVSVVEHKQIFEEPLTSGEQAALNNLVSKHKANAAITQQLAMDASKLVTTSQQRLSQQEGSGFFKRFGNAISGKTSENQLLNQMDMLQLQKFAWHYLQQLQQQNLINAQSISVIRNNLGTMNAYIIETRYFLEQAVDKIDSRLQHVENNTSFNNWALNIEANKRRFKSLPRTLLILRLTYDFMRSHQNVKFTEGDVSNYIVTTLEKLDVNCDQNIRLLDFISELIDQIEIVGIEQYRNLIKVSFDDHVVDSDFIQKNISGIGFNALYFLSDQYEKITDLIGDEQLCNSDESREKIISKLFGAEFSSLSTSYNVRHLMCEIVGASQVAIDIYKTEHGLNTVPDEVYEMPPQEEEVTLVSALPDIRAHTYFDNGASELDKRDYLLLFALCVDNSGVFKAPSLEFLTLLAGKAGQPSILEEILRLTDNPRKLIESQPVVQRLLDDEAVKLTWLLDAFFLLTLNQTPIENPQTKAILGMLKPAQLKERLPQLLTIISNIDETNVLDVALQLIPHTEGWKNVIRYRELHFDKYFAETLKYLQKASWANIQIALEMNLIFGKGMEHAVWISYSDGSFVSNLTEKAGASLCTQGRKAAVSGLNDSRRKAEAFISEHRSALYKANDVISRWKMSPFEFKNELGHNDYDLDNSVENEEWGDQFQLYYRKVEETLNSFDQACSDVVTQIEFFIAGDFDQSVLALKEKRSADSLRQQQQERLAASSVTLVKDDNEYLFSIDWQQVEHPPFDPEQITQIKTDGKIWLVAASTDSSEVFYRSENGVEWRQIQLDIPQMRIWLDKIEVVNGIWIVTNRALSEGTREQGIYYSYDAITWQHNEGPGGKNNSNLSLNQGHLIYNNIVYFKGMWLWVTEKCKNYTYIEKGFWSDSSKTDRYRTPNLFCAQTLDGPWLLWDQTPHLSEGAEIKRLCSLPGDKGLLAFCEYSSSYLRNKKKPDTPPFVMYFGSGNSWQVIDWDSNCRLSHSGNTNISQLGGKLRYFSSDQVFSSAKGYDWLCQQATLRVHDHFDLTDVSLFVSSARTTIHLSQDGEQFQEIRLDAGHWNHITANDGGMLGVYYANKHEKTVLRIGNYVCQAKT